METKLTSGLLFLLLLHLPTCVAQSDDPGDLKEMELRLKCPEILVKAEIGHDVTLNCSSEPQHDLTEDMLGWKFNESITVLLYKHGKLQDTWDDQFKYRAHPDSSWNVSKGKLSVKIPSVTESDSGIYKCFVQINQRQMNCRAELIVEDQKNNTGQPGSRVNNDTLPTEKPAEDPGDEKSLDASAIAGIVVGSVVLVALVVITIVLLIQRKSRNRSVSYGHNSQGGPRDVRFQRVRTEPSTQE